MVSDANNVYSLQYNFMAPFIIETNIAVELCTSVVHLHLTLATGTLSHSLQATMQLVRQLRAVA